MVVAPIEEEEDEEEAEEDEEEEDEEEAEEEEEEEEEYFFSTVTRIFASFQISRELCFMLIMLIVTHSPLHDQNI
jgi:hypothetical protein